MKSEILHLFYQHNKITKKVYNNLIKSLYGCNMVVIRDPKIFCFNFDWSKYVDEDLKHETEFIIKANQVLAEDKIKDETEQLLLKYNHGNNFYKHRKQQNEWVT